MGFHWDDICKGQSITPGTHQEHRERERIFVIRSFSTYFPGASPVLGFILGKVVELKVEESTLGGLSLRDRQTPKPHNHSGHD